MRPALPSKLISDVSSISRTCRPAAATAVCAAAVATISAAVTLGLRKNRVVATISARLSASWRIVAVRRAQALLQDPPPLLQAAVPKYPNPTLAIADPSLINHSRDRITGDFFFFFKAFKPPTSGPQTAFTTPRLPQQKDVCGR